MNGSNLYNYLNKNRDTKQMNSIIIDSSLCQTSLCFLCSKAGTDKGPFTPGGGHRHPYTTPYSLFFEPLRHKNIKFAEVGVHHGASMRVWRAFFSQARLYGFDNDEKNVAYITSMNLPNSILDIMDGSKKDSIVEGFTKHSSDGELFDVIIDDASHSPEDQAMMIRSALPFLKQGGLLIVEDIFRDRPEKPYEEALLEVKNLVSFHTFIMCEHTNRFSPGWNNDKMLVIVRA
jgi:predicted O-methyltransferase YrrM